MTSLLLLGDLSRLRFMPQVDLHFADSVNSLWENGAIYAMICYGLLGHQLRTRLTMRLLLTRDGRCQRTMPSSYEPTAIHAAISALAMPNIPQLKGDGMML